MSNIATLVTSVLVGSTLFTLVSKKRRERLALKAKQRHLYSLLLLKPDIKLINFPKRLTILN